MNVPGLTSNHTFYLASYLASYLVFRVFRLAPYTISCPVSYPASPNSLTSNFLPDIPSDILNPPGQVCGGLVAYTSSVQNAASDHSAAKSEIPSDAVTATASAQGMDGPVEVEVIATADHIYSISVTDENETEGIGRTSGRRKRVRGKGASHNAG